jgi:serine/threonine/tyrosine protein kinase RAD53
LTNAAPFIEDENQRDIRLRISERKVDWSILTQASASQKGQQQNSNFHGGGSDADSTAVHFIEQLLEHNVEKRMSLSQALRHTWLRSYTPSYNLKAYDTVSSLDPHDFSMLSSMPGFNMDASVTTNLNGLQIASNGIIPGPATAVEGKGFSYNQDH